MLHCNESINLQQADPGVADTCRVMQAEDYMAMKFAEAGYDDIFPPGVIPQVCYRKHLQLS